MMATRGRRATSSLGQFMAAARPISEAVSTRPGSTPTASLAKSLPWGRMCLPLTAAPPSTMRTWSPSFSVFSWMTIVSAPAGRAAPVKMRDASPGPTARIGSDPAAIDSTTLRRTGSADRIAIHGGDRLRWMVETRGDGFGERAAESLGDGDTLRPERREGGEDPRGGLLDGEHHAASKVPDLPPLLWVKRISVMRRLLSAAFTMS